MWSTTESEKERLARAVSRYDHPRVLEIGAFQGATTAVLAEAALERGGRVVVIDPMRWAAEVVSNGIVRHLPKAMAPWASKLDRLLGSSSYEPQFWQTVGAARRAVDLRRFRSDDAGLIADRDPALATFDVVFIDGDHSEEGALADLRNWGRRVAPGGVILVHDATDAFPGVVRAIERFAHENALAIGWPEDGSLAELRVEQPLVELPSSEVVLEPAAE